MKHSAIVQSLETKSCFQETNIYTHKHTSSCVPCCPLMVFHHLTHLWCWRPQRKRMLGPPPDPVLHHISRQSLSRQPKPFIFPILFCHFWHMINQKALFKVQDHFKIIDQHSLDGRNPSAEHCNVALLFILSWNTDTQLVAHHPSLHLHSWDAHIMDMSQMAQWHTGVQCRQKKVKIDQPAWFLL